MADRTISAELVLTPNDVRQGLQLMPERRRVLGMLVLIAGATVITCSVLLVTDLTLVIVTALVVGVALAVGARRGVQRAVDQVLAPLGAEPRVSFTFSSEGFETTSAAGEARIKWTSVAKFVEGPSTLLVYTQQNIAQIVPKRAFSDEDLGRIRALLSERIKNETEGFSLLKPLLLWVALIAALLAAWSSLVP